MNQEQTGKIDETVIATVGERWTKVAMVIARVAKILYGALPDGDHAYDSIGCRIEALVKGGQLESKGDIKDWRSSEVRRPTLPEISRFRYNK